MRDKDLYPLLYWLCRAVLALLKDSYYQRTAKAHHTEVGTLHDLMDEGPQYIRDLESTGYCTPANVEDED